MAINDQFVEDEESFVIGVFQDNILQESLLSVAVMDNNGNFISSHVLNTMKQNLHLRVPSWFQDHIVYPNFDLARADGCRGVFMYYIVMAVQLANNFNLLHCCK
jgi:hypothetical protein